MISHRSTSNKRNPTRITNRRKRVLRRRTGTCQPDTLTYYQVFYTRRYFIVHTCIMYIVHSSIRSDTKTYYGILRLTIFQDTINRDVFFQLKLMVDTKK